MRVPATVLLLSCATAAPAAADDWSLHVLGDVRLGWTDNLQSGEDATSTPPKESDEYTQLTPGLLFTWNRPRAINELSAALETNVYVQHDEGWSYMWRAGWRGYFQPSPNGEITTQVVGSGGTLNTFSTSTTAGTGQVVLLPSNSSTFRALDGQESYQLQVSRPWRLTQTALADVFNTRTSDTDVSTTGYRVGGGFGADHAWQYNAVGGSAQVTYDGLGNGDTQMSASALLQWRRDLTAHWTTTVDIGAVTLVPVSGGMKSVVQPTAGAQIGYFPVWGSAALGVRRSVTPDLYIAANTISDSVVMNVGLPIWAGPLDEAGTPKLGVEASAGYAFTSVIDSGTGDSVSGFQAGLADLGIGYTIKPQVIVALRYQYERQRADPTVLETVRSFDRNTVLLSFTGRWPDRVAGEVPTRNTLRVDRSNLTTGGSAETPVDGQRPR